MTARLIDGESIAETIRSDVRQVVSDLPPERRPHLVSILVGDHPPARAYQEQQKAAAKDVGISFEDRHLDGDVHEQRLLQMIDELNEDDGVTGILVQLPLPDHIDTARVQERIHWTRDVEGVHPRNMGMLVSGRYELAPCTALAARRILREMDVDIAGKEVTVIGHSAIVGKPIALMLLAYSDQAATTTVCHEATKDVSRHTRQSDIVITAVGKAGFLTGDMLKEGAIVIDIGISFVPERDERGNLIRDKNGDVQKVMKGDLDLASAESVASWITPVPGGVGPITVAMLMRNTVACMNLQDDGVGVDG